MWTTAANFRRTQPKSIGLVWGLAATRRSVYIHQMNRVNSRNDSDHDDSTINIVMAIIIIIIKLPTCEWHLCWVVNREAVTTVSLESSAEKRQAAQRDSDPSRHELQGDFVAVSSPHSFTFSHLPSNDVSATSHRSDSSDSRHKRQR